MPKINLVPNIETADANRIQPEQRVVNGTSSTNIRSEDQDIAITSLSSGVSNATTKENKSQTPLSETFKTPMKVKTEELGKLDSSNAVVNSAPNSAVKLSVAERIKLAKQKAREQALKKRKSPRNETNVEEMTPRSEVYAFILNFCCL